MMLSSQPVFCRLAAEPVWWLAERSEPAPPRQSPPAEASGCKRRPRWCHQPRSHRLLLQHLIDPPPYTACYAWYCTTYGLRRTVGPAPSQLEGKRIASRFCTTHPSAHLACSCRVKRGCALVVSRRQPCSSNCASVADLDIDTD